MPPVQDDIRVAPTDSDRNPVVVVNGKEVVVSSATEKPKRSLWIAWLYMFDVSTPPHYLLCMIYLSSSRTQAHVDVLKHPLRSFTVVSEPLLARREEAGA